MLTGDVTVQILGPVRILRRAVGPDDGEDLGADDAEVVEVPSASQRRLLGALAVNAPDPVRAEWLCNLLDVTPGALRTSVARLRRSVGDDLVRTAVGGYRLAAAVDAAIACAEIRSAGGDPSMLRRALARWAGPALDEFHDEAWAVGEVVRLGEVRATATEDLAQALLTSDRMDEAIALLEAHAIEHRHRDRPRGLLMRALAAAGRQTEALRVFEDYRRFLAESAGTEPSEDLRRIEQRILSGWDGIRSVPASPRTDVGSTADRGSAPLVDGYLERVPAGVGRNRELAELARVADRLTEGAAVPVVVSGDVGIGKTTLLAGFARGHCRGNRWTVLYGRCDEMDAVPFEPFRVVISRLFDELSDEAVMSHTARCGGDLLRLVPQLRTRITAPPSGEVDDTTARHLLFEAVLDALRRASAERPVVVILDDFQWAETSAIQLLRHLVRNLADTPVLVLLGVRGPVDALGEQLRALLAELVRCGAVSIDLDPFDERELAEFVRARLPRAVGHDVTPIVRELQTETAGNPLFAEHLFTHWLDNDRIRMEGSTLVLTTGPELDVPPTLRELVWQRVSSLGQGVEALLSAASVLGLDFNERVLSRMVASDHLPVDRLLDRASDAGLLASDPAVSGATQFAHALVAHALEANLGDRERTSLHGAAFRAILDSRRGSETAAATRLARHAAAGGLIPEAQRWATVAGDQALDNFAPDEAASWFAAALEHADTADALDSERAALLVRLGEALTRTGDPSALGTIHRGAELALRCGALDTLVRAALATDRGTLRSGSSALEQLEIVEAALACLDDWSSPDGIPADHRSGDDSTADHRTGDHRTGDRDLAIRARLTALLAQSLMATDQAARRTAAALDALELARTSLDPTLLARVAPDILLAMWEPGSAPTRSALAAEVTATADELNDPHLAFAANFAAFNSAVCAGDATAASRYLERVHQVVTEVPEPRMRWAAGTLDAFVSTMGASFTEAERIIADTLEIGVEAGEPEALAIFAAQSFSLGTFAGRHAELLPFIEAGLESEVSVQLPFRIGHAIVCCEVGRPEVAVALLREAMEAGLEAIPNDFMRATALIGYVVLALELRDEQAARWLYPAVMPLASEVSFNGITSQGPISAYAGKLASLLGHFDDAERFLLAALVVTEAFGWEYHRASTLVALADNRLRSTGELTDEGEQWLATAESICATHGIGFWASRARSIRTRVTRD